MRGFRGISSAFLALAFAFPVGADQNLDSLRERNERYEKEQIEEQQAKTRWQTQLRALLSERDAARTRQAKAQKSYKSMRSRNRLRGDKRASVQNEVEAARTALAAAEQNLEDFYKGARRAGVPRGWLRLRDRDS